MRRGVGRGSWRAVTPVAVAVLALTAAPSAQAAPNPPQGRSAPLEVQVSTTAWPDRMAIDPDFDLRGRGLRGRAEAVTVRSDGTILAAGRWTLFRNRRDLHMGVAAVRPDGTPIWPYTQPFDREIEAMAVDGQGRLLVAGCFSRVGGTSVPGYARLMPDGTVDPSFTAGATYSRVGDIDVGPAGTVVLATRSPRMLADDGSVRATVTSIGFFDPKAAHVAALPDGGALLGGDLTATSVNSRGTLVGGPTTRNAIARVDSRGVVDPRVALTMPADLVGLVATPDGGGWAASADGSLLRLAPDGSTSFVRSPVQPTAVQPLEDGGVAVLGRQGRAGAIAVLDAAGSVDRARSFLGSNSIGGTVKAIASDGQGRLVVGGDFGRVDQFPSPGITRIGRVDGPATFSTNGSWPRRSQPDYLPLRTRSRVACVLSNCGHKPNDPHGYWAIDFLGVRGDPVFPAGAGIVHVGGRFKGCGVLGKRAGTWVWVNHGRGVTTRYFHLNSLAVRDGQYVTPDTRLGNMGRTGALKCLPKSNDMGYLHFEVRSGGDSTADRVPVGSLVGCVGSGAVAFPQAFGTTNWNSLEPYVNWVYSDGTACRQP